MHSRFRDHLFIDDNLILKLYTFGAKSLPFITTERRKCFVRQTNGALFGAIKLIFPKVSQMLENFVGCYSNCPFGCAEKCQAITIARAVCRKEK